MLTDHKVRCLSSLALLSSSVQTVGNADDISLLFTMSESVSELRNWCYRQAAVRSNCLDFSWAVSQPVSVGQAKCSQFTYMQISRPDVWRYVSEDNNPVHININFSTSLTVQLKSRGLWCFISMKYSRHAHRNIGSSSTSWLSDILF